MYSQFMSSQTTRKSADYSVFQCHGFLSFVLVLNLFIHVVKADQHTTRFSHCPSPTLVDIFLPLQDRCPAADHNVHSSTPMVPRVAELNETTLEKALDLVHNSNGTYMTVLYYANWCPFSKKLHPVYDVLSSVFPSVHHVAVEEAAVRPSVLSQYGVHSFPTIFVHNRTARVRYHGPRTLKDFVSFYENYTGLQPASKGKLLKGEDCPFASLVFTAVNGSKVVCPYPWAISPQKWLQDDAYLTLATLFLVLRVMYFVLPVVASVLKRRWNMRHNSLRENLLASFERSQLAGNSAQNVDNGELAKVGRTQASGVGGISVPGWLPSPRQMAPSGSSAGPLALAESSSSRAGQLEEVCEVGGRLRKVDLERSHRSPWRY